MELGGGFLLDAEDDGVGPPDADGGVALADGFESVLHLKQMTVGREDGDRAIVSSHDLLFFLGFFPTFFLFSCCVFFCVCKRRGGH